MGAGYVKLQECSEPIVAMAKLGGYFKKEIDGKRVWYPERLIVAHKCSIYEYIPEENVVAVYQGKTTTAQFVTKKNRVRAK